MSIGMYATAEDDEITRLAAKLGTQDVGTLLRSRLMPLQRSIGVSRGQIVALLSRGYDQCSFDTPTIMYCPEENLEVGIIGERTSLPFIADTREEEKSLVSLSALLVRVEKAVNLNFNRHRGLEIVKGDTFYGCMYLNNLNTLLFMHRKPEYPSDGDGFDIGEHSHTPRLRFFVGDKKAIPMLQGRIPGYEYVRLSSFLGRDLPLTEKLVKKIGKEQVDAFEEVVSAERAFGNYEEWFTKRLSQIKASGGEKEFPSTRPQASQLELHDEVSWVLNFGGELSERERKLYSAVQTGINRGYHRKGIGRVINLQDGPGVKRTIDIPMFFYDRMQKFELLQAGK